MDAILNEGHTKTDEARELVRCVDSIEDALKVLDEAWSDLTDAFEGDEDYKQPVSILWGSVDAVLAQKKAAEAAIQRIREQRTADGYAQFDISPFVGLQDALRSTTEGRTPPCALTCGCIKVRTKHLNDRLNRYTAQILIAIRIVCDLRGIPQNSQNLNDVWGEIHSIWLDALRRTGEGDAA
jgi:hypothetical protein